MVRRTGLVLGMLVLVLLQVAQGQRRRECNYNPCTKPSPELNDITPPVGQSPQEKRSQDQVQLEAARRPLQELQKESEQLITLANELKAELDTTAGQALSLEAIKKARQIEKLAKDIRSKINGR